MKRPIAILLCIVMILSISGCNNLSSNENEGGLSSLLTREEQDELVQNVINYIIELDTEKLSLLFSDKIQAWYDLEAQIKGLEEYFDGDIVEYGHTSCTCGGMSSDEDGCYEYTLAGTIYDVKTDGGKEYLITFTYYEIHPNGEEYEGLASICIKCLSDKDEDGHMSESAFYTIGNSQI